MFPLGSKQSTVTLDITSTIGSVNSPTFTSTFLSSFITMPQSSTRLSWMGQHTHRIQAGEPGPSNPDSCRQLAQRTARAQGKTPFDFNQYNHKVGGLPCVFVCKANLFLTRSVGISVIRIQRPNRFLIASRISGLRRRSPTSGGTTFSR